MNEVRRTGDHIWRLGGGVRLAWLLTGSAVLAGTIWLWSEGGLPLKERLLFGAVDVALVTLTPVMLVRWRMVLDSDAVHLVFVRVRSLPLREIVDAKSVPREGLTFVLGDGRTESIGLLGNAAWDHRRKTETRADLAARAVLCAAAASRGEDSPVHFRLPPMRGFRKAAIEGGIWAAVVAFVVGG